MNGTENGIQNRGYVADSLEMVNGDVNGNANGKRKPSVYSVENGFANGDRKTTTLDDPTLIDESGTGKERPVWSNSVEFLMSCIAMSVGLGNIWRFPFTAYENGGGAFLIPYIIVLIIIGRPMYYMEMALGQFTSRSAVKSWNLSPILKGIGTAQVVGVICIITYYTSLIALTLFYMFHSFVEELPWGICKAEWGPNCVDSKPNGENSIARSNNSFSSSEAYFLKDVLKEIDDISDGIGLPDWQLSLWLLLAWVIIFLIIIRGVKSSGKVSYFLALFPYVIIIALLIKACTLDGAVDGILFFFKPQWSELLNPQVWYKATTQLFFSLSVGMGTITMFSSYNQFNHNIYRDAAIVTTLDTFTSLLAGTTIFAILGNLAHNLKVEDIGQVVKSGTALAFISYPDAISKFDVASQVFAVLFFFMLFVLGIGSVVALHSALTTVIWDQFPKVKYWIVALGGSIACFFIGLMYVTPGGQWMLNLVDHYGGTFLIFVLAILELVGIFWIYGLENFCLDIEFMTKRKTGIYWRLCWGIITPCFMIVIFVYSMATLEPLTYSKHQYPDGINAFGWCIFVIGMIIVPVWAMYLVQRKSVPFFEAVKQGFKPNSQWGPKDDKKRLDWTKFKEDAIQRRRQTAFNEGHSKIRQGIYILLGIYK